MAVSFEVCSKSECTIRFNEFWELNQLSKSIYQKLTEVFKQNGINSIKKKNDSNKGKQEYSVEGNDGEMYLVNKGSDFSGKDEANSSLSDDNYLPCKVLKADEQNLNDSVHNVPGTSKVKSSVLRNILSMEPTGNFDKLRKDDCDKTNNSEKNNVEFESYLYNDLEVFGRNMPNNKQQKRKAYTKRGHLLETKRKNQIQVLKSIDYSLHEDKDIDEEKKELDRLIKDEVMAGLIKTEIAPPEPFDFSQVPDLPELATTHSEANQYMKSYMHSEGIVECVPCNRKFNYKSSYTKHCESERHHKQEAIFNGTALKRKNMASTKKTKSKKRRTIDDTESEDNTDETDEEYDEKDENSDADEKNDDSDEDETNGEQIDQKDDSSNSKIDENYTSSLKEDKSRGGNTGMKLIIKRK
ncbi:unnamed protein product [Mytilus coruscus]|uniref:C2H2-type domain-containing protein n=1 Tax=Mytilus coruscus TaxID=42192 RepID=A0A6J7ZXW5_MYTCO|nr:unnamed protein product [Mytilus coruscus]